MKWRLSLAVVVIVFLAAIGWWFNYVVGITVGVSLFLCGFLFYVVPRLWQNSSPILKPVVVGVLLVAVGTLYFWQGLPRSGDPEQYSDAEAPYVIEATELPDETQEDRWSFEERYFVSLTQAERVEACGVLLAQAEEVLSALRRPDEEPEGQGSLHSALKELRTEIKEYESLEAIRNKTRELQSFLESKLEEMSKTPPENLRDFKNDFEIQVTNRSMSDLYSAMERVEFELQKTLESRTKSLSTLDTALSAELVEEDGKGKWILEEIISIGVPTKVRITEIDASQLRREAETRNFKHRLLFAYGDQEPEESDKARIRVNPQAKSLKLISRVEVPAKIPLVSAKFKAVAMRYVLFRWTNPFPAKLKIVADLSEVEGLPKDFSFLVPVERDEQISEVRLPGHSYYTSGDPFSKRHFGSKDVLKPKDDNFKPSVFRTRNHVWIELLPPSWVYRNPLVQKYKARLFSSDLIVTLIVALLAAIATALVAGKPSV